MMSVGKCPMYDQSCSLLPALTLWYVGRWYFKAAGLVGEGLNWGGRAVGA